MSFLGVTTTTAAAAALPLVFVVAGDAFAGDFILPFASFGKVSVVVVVAVVVVPCTIMGGSMRGGSPHRAVIPSTVISDVGWMSIAVDGEGRACNVAAVFELYGDVCICRLIGVAGDVLSCRDTFVWVEVAAVSG